MAPKQEVENPDFADLKNSIDALKSAITAAATAAKGQRARTENPERKIREAVEEMQESLLGVMSSPLRPNPRSGYGPFEPNGVEPVRRLYAMLRSRNQDGSPVDTAKSIEEAVRAVVSYLDPHHPFSNCVANEQKSDSSTSDGKSRTRESNQESWLTVTRSQAAAGRTATGHECWNPRRREG
jgi:hypothetical protein